MGVNGCAFGRGVGRGCDFGAGIEHGLAAIVNIEYSAFVLKNYPQIYPQMWSGSQRVDSQLARLDRESLALQERAMSVLVRDPLTAVRAPNNSQGPRAIVVLV